MKFEHIKGWNAKQIEERKAQIAEEIKTADEARLNDLNEELDAVEARVKELDLEQRRADMTAVATGAGSILGTAPKKEERTLDSVRGSAEYENAYAEYMKTGKADECRALLTDLVEGGSVPIPTYVEEEIANTWTRKRNRIVTRLRRMNIKGVVEFPFEVSATGATTHTEGGDAADEESLVIGAVAAVPSLWQKWISVSREVMKLKGRAFIDYVYGEIEDKILAHGDDVFVAALVAAPATSTTSAVAVPKLTPAVLEAGTVFAGLAALDDDAENPVAIMNKATYFNQIMGLKDTTGRPIYNIVSENGKPRYYWNGLEVFFNNRLDTGNNARILVGDLDGAVLNLPDGQEVSFITDQYTNAKSGKVDITGDMYAAVAIVKPNYFAVITLTPAVQAEQGSTDGQGGTGGQGGTDGQE